MIRELKQIMLNNINEQVLKKDEIKRAKTLKELGLDFR